MFHLRFTPYDISGYTFDFLDFYDKYIIGYETKNKKGIDTAPHYHIWIVTDLGDQSVRKSAKVALKIPPAGRGKNNMYYSLDDDWKDITYICKYDDIKKSKGYTEAELLRYAVEGRKKYLTARQETELSGEAAPAVPKPAKIPKIPFQQEVIASAAADWINYKRECRENEDYIEKSKVLDFVCDAMRKHGKGINVYLVSELANAVLYDDLEYRDVVMAKLRNVFLKS